MSSSEQVIVEEMPHVSASFDEYIERKKIEELKKKQSVGGNTSLISLYIPGGRRLSDIVNELSQELSTANNIRSKLTRKNVMAALTSLIGRLKQMGHKAPENGLAIFAGITTESRGNVEVHIIVPPKVPINRKLYLCDNHFHVEYLEETLGAKESYALVAIDGKEATIGVLTGDHLEIIKQMKSGAVRKHRAGGQSSVRFARLHEEAVNRFIKKVADFLKDYFIEQGHQIKGLVIGGPGYVKERLVPQLDKRLKDILVDVVDIGYAANVQGLEELVTVAEEKLQEVPYVHQKQLVQKWLNALYENKATFGEAMVRKYLEMGAVEVLLISEELDMRRITLKCPSCGYEEAHSIQTAQLEDFKKKVAQRKCPQCQSSLLNIEKVVDMVEDLGRLAAQYGTQVEIISTATSEGQQVLNFGGVCAILRYKIEEY